MEKAVSPDAMAGVLPESLLSKIRIPFVQRAVVTLGPQEQQVFLVDLGLAGVFVESRQPIPLGETVGIRFSLPGNEIPLSARCRVAWRHGLGEDEPLRSRSLPPGMGLAFVEVSPADLARIRKHVVDHLGRGRAARRFAPRWPDLEEEP
jgi:hypothetical protein